MADVKRTTCILYVLKQAESGIVGKIQFYLKAKDRFQVIDGCGADLRDIDNKTLMCISRIQNNAHMLSIKDLSGTGLNHNIALNLSKGDFVV